MNADPGQWFTGSLLAHCAADRLARRGQVIEDRAMSIRRQSLAHTGPRHHGHKAGFDARPLDAQMHDALPAKSAHLKTSIGSDLHRLERSENSEYTRHVSCEMKLSVHNSTSIPRVCLQLLEVRCQILTRYLLHAHEANGRAGNWPAFQIEHTASDGH